MKRLALALVFCGLLNGSLAVASVYIIRGASLMATTGAKIPTALKLERDAAQFWQEKWLILSPLLFAVCWAMTYGFRPPFRPPDSN